ncbi:hypothetical protein GW781_03540 [bacterium]|nr:hypothetical protein [bacterium]NCT20207.1 hypothetical protein [bacterium]OIO86969.1 MAG: hypothetical protein AUK01_01510 [Anaerolineae bacterium CG2_30_57_67]
MRPYAILFLLVLAGLVVAFAPLPAHFSAPVARTFHVEASQFAYQPGEISVNPGDKVTIELVSTDVVHGLYVDGYGVSVKADPGQNATLTFVADKSGSFRLRCNVTCGAMHPFMVGKLNVGANTWLYRSLALASLGIFSVFVLARTTKME